MGPRSRPAILICVIAVGLVSAACSKSSSPGASPTENTVPPGVIGAVPSGAIGPGGTLPSGSPGAATGALHSGQLSLHVSGDIQSDSTLSELVSTIYSPPPGAMAVVWTAGGTDPTSVGIGGLTFVGTRPTSSTLTLTFAAVGSATETFTSSNGECSITIDAAEDSQIAGSFTCTGVSSGTGGTVVDASGTFQASG